MLSIDKESNYGCSHLWNKVITLTWKCISSCACALLFATGGGLLLWLVLRASPAADNSGAEEETPGAATADQRQTAEPRRRQEPDPDEAQSTHGTHRR